MHFDFSCDGQEEKKRTRHALSTQLMGWNDLRIRDPGPDWKKLLQETAALGFCGNQVFHYIETASVPGSRDTGKLCFKVIISIMIQDMWYVYDPSEHDNE